MIVTCPGCASKYRVKNDSVPADGARMKCPKCSTLFLAKPPAGGAPETQHLEEPSNQFQALAPQPPTSSTPRTATPPPAPAPAPAPKPAAGPVTSLFGAFDMSQIPADQRPPPPAQAPAPPPAAPTSSGLELGGSAGGSAPARAPIVQPTVAARPIAMTASPAPVVARAHSAPSKLPYVLVGLGGAVALAGVVVFAWASELAPLDDTLTPLFAPFGASPIAQETVSVEDLRTTAKSATERGDLVAAILAWERVDVRAKDDPQARTEMASLREKLGERQTR